MDSSFYAFSMLLKITFIFSIFYLIVVFGNPLEKARIKCPRGSEAIMDNDLSERPCYKVVHQRMSYFEASRACKSSNGFIPGINNNLKDISITSTALILKQLYNEYYFWLGCQNLTGKFICDDGTLLGNYNNWDPNSNSSHGSCVVVSLTTGKWKMADCLGKYAFTCKYRALFDASTTPESNETEPTIPPKNNQTRGQRTLKITVDLTNLHIKLPDYTGIFLWLFGILIFIFGCLQCLCYQFFRCLKNMEMMQSQGRRTNNYSNPCQERMRGRTFSGNQFYGRNQRFGTIGSNNLTSVSGIYSPDPSEEARLLESREEFRQRAFSTFSNQNWIPTTTTINAQIQQNSNSPPRSVIITIPPCQPQSPEGANIDELLNLHGHYGNYPSLPRSEISSILEQLSGGSYIPREDRAWDLPPQYPIYYRTAEDEEIGVALSRNIPQQLLLPPPPYSDFNVVQPSSPTFSIPSINWHNNNLPLIRNTVPPRPQHIARGGISNVRILGVPVLPPALETFENRIRQSQNRRRNNFAEENERLFKKRV